jgi:hypothetical protein
MIRPIVQRIQDYLLERQIKALYRAFLKASTNDEIGKVWDLYINTIKQRSPSQVKRMEQEKGLCR